MSLAPIRCSQCDCVEYASDLPTGWWYIKDITIDYSGYNKPTCFENNVHFCSTKCFKDYIDEIEIRTKEACTIQDENKF